LGRKKNDDMKKKKADTCSNHSGKGLTLGTGNRRKCKHDLQKERLLPPSGEKKTSAIARCGKEGGGGTSQEGGDCRHKKGKTQGGPRGGEKERRSKKPPKQKGLHL